MATQEYLNSLKKKITAGEEISKEDEIIYLREVLKLPQQELNRIFAVIENEDPNVLID
jgi:hypothetical protein